MTAVREKAQGFTKQLIGEMIGDGVLVQEGKQQQEHAQEHAEEHNEAPSPAPSSETPAAERGDR